MTPVHRFAGVGSRAVHETIGSDTRIAIGTSPAVSLAYGIDAAAGAAVVELPEALLGAAEVVVTGVLEDERGLRALPARVLAVDPAVGSHGGVAIELAGEDRPVGAAKLFLEGRRPQPVPVHVVTSAPVDVPMRCYLQVGIGILPSAREQGAVEFSVERCEKERCERIFFDTVDPGDPTEGEPRWRDYKIPVGRHSGKGLTFRFVTRTVEPGDHRFALSAWANPTLFSPADRRGPNLILISMDTLRADHLPAYGYPRDTAPFTSELAEQGTLFEQVLSAATTTGPSHMTLFTSLQPSVHGVRGNTGIRPLSPAAATLAEQLRAGGYSTGAVTENAAIALGRGFERGFETYRENRKAESSHTEGHVARTFTAGLRWIARHHDQPFFLFLHSYQVHSPYLPPPRYATLFSEPIPGREPHPDLAPRFRPVLYDREIRYVDDQLRRLWQRLKNAGLLDDTLIVFTSDHGEEFLEHGFLAHGADIHEEILRVPLILVGPGIPAGRRVTTPVGLVDLMPTILDLLGLPEAPGVMGSSFADLARGRDGDGKLEDRPIYSEAWRATGMTAGGVIHVDQPTFAVRRGSRKLVRYRTPGGHRYSFYDLAVDPQERDDRYDEMREQVADLRELLDHYEELTASLHDDLAAAGGDAPGIAPDAEREAKLRALGYVE